MGRIELELSDAGPAPQALGKSQLQGIEPFSDEDGLHAVNQAKGLDLEALDLDERTGSGQLEHGPTHVESQCRRVFRRVAKCSTIGFMSLIFLGAAFHHVLHIHGSPESRAFLLSVLFLVGLLGVALEEVLLLNKSALVLFLATTMWTLLAMGYSINSSKQQHILHKELGHELQDVGSVVLFLLPAMAVVETIDHFQGFALVTCLIHYLMAGKTSRLMPIVCVLTFFLSSIIDNLTATIVALKILRLTAHNEDYRKDCGGVIVIAANAGGAWSPVGDVTTTMLWIQEKISTANTIRSLFLPSFVAGMLPVIGMYLQSSQRAPKQRRKGSSTQKPSEGGGSFASPQHHEDEPLRPDDDMDSLFDGERTFKTGIVLGLGICCILTVPALKMLTGLPPYLGMLFALGVMWLCADTFAWGDPKANNGHASGVIAALHKVDLSGLLFFTGVLLSVGCLNSAGVLHSYAGLMVETVGHNAALLSSLLGLSSAVVDNVPLVEAVIDMFGDTPKDDELWQLTALAAGTGGSILSIGSVAGVTFMSVEGISFIWYVQRVSFWALLGFAAGIGTYVLQDMLT